MNAADKVTQSSVTVLTFHILISQNISALRFESRDRKMAALAKKLLSVHRTNMFDCDHSLLIDTAWRIILSKYLMLDLSDE